MSLFFTPNTTGSSEFFPGSGGEVVAAPPALHVVRSKFPGVVGESQIFLERGGRPLMCSWWVHGAYIQQGGFSYSELQNALALFDARVGEVGELLEVIDATSDQMPYPEVCFEGFERTPIGDKHGPMIDVSGQLGWFCPGVLRFYQLRYEASA